MAVGNIYIVGGALRINKARLLQRVSSAQLGSAAGFGRLEIDRPAAPRAPKRWQGEDRNSFFVVSIQECRRERQIDNRADSLSLPSPARRYGRGYSAPWLAGGGCGQKPKQQGSRSCWSRSDAE